MSLVGNLEDLGLGEILQIVSLSRKSGILVIQSSGREARVFFRQGQVVKASSTVYPLNLADELASRGLSDPSAIESAAAIQQSGGFRQRLGEILISEGSIDAGALEELVRQLVENVVYSLFSWEEGTFDFELQDNLENVDDIRTDHLQFILGQGLNAQFLAMEGSRLIDELRYAGEPGQPEASEESVDFAFDLLQGEDLPAFEPPPLQPAAPPRHLVLVDDDDTTRELIAAMLHEKGWVVSRYAKSEDALIGIDGLCRDGHQPTLLVDLIMPRMDGTGLLGGLELLELIHANFPAVKALSMADHHNTEAERQLRAMGYLLISKPPRASISNPDICSSFCGRLALQLERVEAGDSAGLGYTVNIGDELRMEMGETAISQSVAVLQSTGISLLRGMLEELNNPALGGGIILLVLRFAAEFMGRAVIFIVKQDEIAGLGQFGIDDRELTADARIRSIRMPRHEKTLFSEVVESQLPVKLQPDDSRWSRYLLEQLGGRPNEVFLGPIVSEEKVVAILYGDNGDGSSPIGDTDSLEIFLSQAGIAMEKALLQRRLKDKHSEGM
jgi:CheY-like chemotaxis protein